jgi:hypothetical protein
MSKPDTITPELPELNTIKTATIHNWDVSSPKSYLGYDTNSGIQAKLIKPSASTEPLTNTNISNKDIVSKGGAVERHSETYTNKEQHVRHIDITNTNKPKPWIIELSYGGKPLATLRERVLDQSKVLVPKVTPKPGDGLALTKLIQEARDKDLIGISLNSLVYRYTSNNNLYRLFFGTVNKESKLLPELHYSNIYARLHRNPMATLQVNLEHHAYDPEQDFQMPESELPTMEQIYSGTY